MTTLKFKYTGDLRTEITHVKSGAKIATVAPEDNHGKGDGFSPTDLFVASYGSCVLTIIGISAQSHGFSIDGAEVTVEKIMAANPRRVGEIIVDVVLPHNNYSEKERKFIELAADQCPVRHSLDPAIKITKTFAYKQ